jgi:hypothetical protein
VKKLLLKALCYAAASLFPLYCMTAGSVQLAQKYSPCVSVLGAVVASGVVAAMVLLVVMPPLRKKHKKAAILLGLGVAVLFGSYSLFFLEEVSFKDPQVSEEYSNLHPSLRLAVGGMTLLDSEFLLTDISRTREDYRKMGLPTNHGSSHLVQKTGYVHAVDIRTKGRGVIRNIFLRAYFRLLGLRTIRHVGTADHLHVQLPQ